MEAAPALLEHDHPLLALRPGPRDPPARLVALKLADEVAMAQAEGGVASQAEVELVRRELEPLGHLVREARLLAIGLHQLLLALDRAQLVGDRPDEHDVALVQLGPDHDDGVETLLSASPGENQLLSATPLHQSLGRLGPQARATASRY
jgi:hypothetical protein